MDTELVNPWIYIRMRYWRRWAVVAVMIDWQVKSDRAVNQQVLVDDRCSRDDHDDSDIEIMFPASNEGSIICSVYNLFTCCLTVYLKYWLELVPAYSGIHFLPSMLWYCWFGIRKTIWPVKVQVMSSPWRKSRSCGAQFLRKFRPFVQNRNFLQIFALTRNFCAYLRPCGVQFFAKFLRILQFPRNLREHIYVFPLMFAFSVLGWLAINFCTNWAKIGLLCYILWRFTCMSLWQCLCYGHLQFFCGTVTVWNLETCHSVQLPAQNSHNTQHHRLNVLYANITNYAKNLVVLRLTYYIS